MKRDEAIPVMEGAVCPVPLAHDETVVMGHGSGGRMTHDLVQRRFQRVLGNPALEQGDDAAVLPLPEGPGRLAITTDAHIVAPLFFPGGDIGRLAVCGTVNDLAVMGAKPLWLTAGLHPGGGPAAGDARSGDRIDAPWRPRRPGW